MKQYLLLGQTWFLGQTWLLGRRLLLHEPPPRPAPSSTPSSTCVPPRTPHRASVAPPQPPPPGLGPRPARSAPPPPDPVVGRSGEGGRWLDPGQGGALLPGGPAGERGRSTGERGERWVGGERKPSSSYQLLAPMKNCFSQPMKAQRAV